jgi:hypothetical protein
MLSDFNQNENIMTYIKKLKIKFYEIRKDTLEFNVLWTVHREMLV